MKFLDWQFTAQDDELLDPARYQYREALVLLDAMYRDTPVMWCPYIYVDNDAALARGWTQGFPKKMGSIFQTRTFAAASPAAAPIVPGGRFGASLSAHGQRLAEACITLRRPVENGLSRHASRMRMLSFGLALSNSSRKAGTERLFCAKPEAVVPEKSTGSRKLRPSI